MPGPYAHITLLHELRLAGRLEKIFQSSSGCAASLTKYFSYGVLGTVSPDYPNLAPGEGTASHWADVMHCTRACEMIVSGIRHVRKAKGAAREKQLAWLLGYASHMAADVTIHPLVQAKVGVYAENQRRHRICEMNQDSYIYRRMNQGEIGEDDDFALTVMSCCNPDNRTELDRDIVTLWEGMLEDVHPDLFATNQPDCASWHRAFVARVDECCDSRVRLFPLADVIAATVGVPYPVFNRVGRRFVANLVVPLEESYCLDYDDVFDQAADTVAIVWRLVEQAVCSVDMVPLPVFGDWNLDTGRDEHGRLVFWD